MALPNYFISCDWGTSNFRLRVVETTTLTILAEHKTDCGIKLLYENFLKQREKEQTQFFADYLKEQISSLPKEHQKHIIVAAGMASANIGLFELNYADFPLNTCGNNLIWKHLVFNNNIEILLISGAKTNSGMMRGEEIQAVGLEQELKPYKKGFLLLPGTHSKHLTYDNGIYTDLKNYMTGELFEVLSKKSILVNSVSTTSSTLLEKPFLEGVSLGLQGQLSASLFSIRAKDLLQTKTKEENYFFLSGLLIGDEISYLEQTTENIFLVAPDPVFSLYKLALKQIINPKQLILLDDKVLENALLLGQKKILLQYENNKAL
ncbi:2-dehydro-3-deoxygalactonokinase [Cellulophaga lytica]|uniref:2-dehydro-3-deoxygalactonokinase n=1 Tax=Cellulophaga lytica TaxID=979 RepID=UPI0004F7C350|nr:2-dehydro-3-deoxygalactonokinase [Cellulophaga lytica]AIM60632.1 2-keto-3-deoxy-galactonokinase [Cellulophaga lytica]SNQ44855.1 2-Dehydro-3-deoxygalactonokinase [Cellulophaga lytica]